MEWVPKRLAAWWRTLDSKARVHGSFLALAGLVYTIHYLVYCIPQPFYIEDAGISFAYARHLVEGEGLVTYPGGERVEGFSNPTWTYLMAALYAVGIPFWTASKVMGWLLGLLTLPFVWGLTRRAMPQHTGFAPGSLAMLAPFMLALNLNFVVWNSSGLENSLFCFLLAGGMYRLMRETLDGGRSWSAVFFLFLCLSRPEGIMYAGLAGMCRLLFIFFPVGQDASTTLLRRLVKVAGWAAIVLVPFALYQWWRYTYFGWEFPNTYYAKLGTGRAFKPYAWNRKGWRYIQGWLLQHGTIGVMPLIFLVMAGFKKKRWLVALLLMIPLGVLCGWDGRSGLDNPPDFFSEIQPYWVKIRVWSIAAVILIAGLMSLGRPGWRSRGVIYLNTVAGVFFVLYVGGDWMKAHRWFNLISVPMICILAVTFATVSTAIAGVVRPGTLRGLFPSVRAGVGLTLLGLLTLGWTINEVRLTHRFANNPETSVRDINRRVKYMTGVQKRLDVDHITLLDVDMGAHMMFSGWDIVDIAGLVDVPMARHSDFNNKFIREYIFKERKPDFAHVHAGWARSSRIDKKPAWKREYIEIPGYPIGKRKMHIGNHIRKDLFVNRDDTRESLVDFEGSIGLIDVSIPAPEVQPGGKVFISTTWRAKLRKTGFRIVAVLDDGAGHQTSAMLPPGYDWYPVKDWKQTETVGGKYTVFIPNDLPQGSYSLSLIVLDVKTGRVLRASQPEGAADSPYLSGGYVAKDRVQVVSAAAAGAAASTDLSAAMSATALDDCDSAWVLWKNAKRHVPFREPWHSRHEPEVKTALARCYATRSDTAEDQASQIADLIAARRWDHRDAAVIDRARPLAAVLDQAGDALWEEGDVEQAYDAYSAAMALDPRLSRTRRKAEDVRDLRLNIIRPENKKKRR
jgi:hypothetical protein